VCGLLWAIGLQCSGLPQVERLGNSYSSRPQVKVRVLRRTGKSGAATLGINVGRRLSAFLCVEIQGSPAEHAWQLGILALVRYLRAARRRWSANVNLNLRQRCKSTCFKRGGSRSRAGPPCRPIHRAGHPARV